MVASVFERLMQYALLMRVHRPIGALLLLWPTLWALWLSTEGNPTPWIAAVFIAGVLVMRAAGCVINDYADRELDAHVARTQDRPLATGRVQPREALVVFAVLCVVAFALVLTLNLLTLALSFVGVFLAGTYPFLKRYTHLPQLYLGVAFGWGIPMAFAAETNGVPPLGWILLCANVFWALAYDTMYAMTDRSDDLRVGAKSTAILFGALDRFMVGLSQLCVLGLLIWVGVAAALTTTYYVGLVIASGFGLYQQYLIREREPSACFAAFLNNNWLGGIVFAGIFFAY